MPKYSRRSLQTEFINQMHHVTKFWSPCSGGMKKRLKIQTFDFIPRPVRLQGCKTIWIPCEKNVSVWIAKRGKLTKVPLDTYHAVITYIGSLLSGSGKLLCKFWIHQCFTLFLRRLEFKIVKNWYFVQSPRVITKRILQVRLGNASCFGTLFDSLYPLQRLIHSSLRKPFAMQPPWFP